jgi:outer membrane protein assembly factor BamB
VEWSEGQNIHWKISPPGKGHSTPIVWGDRIFLTTAVPYGDPVEPARADAPGAHHNLPLVRPHEFVVLAIDRGDGKVVWKKTVHKERPRESGHHTASLASASPLTDGERVLAFFGSRGLFCLSLDGELQWQKDLGEMLTKHAHGEGSSPVLHGDTVVVNWDHEGESFVIAFDKRTGEQRWKVARNEVTSWSSPIVIEHGGTSQVVIPGTERVRGQDLLTGKVLWECGGLSHNVVASPVAADGMVIVTSSYEKQALLAIRLDDARGDITGTDAVAWSRTRMTPYVPSPLLYRGSLYFLRHYQGILSRVNARTGHDERPPVRLLGLRDIYASPVAASGRVYITDLEGVTLVISHDGEHRVLATNRLDDSFSASAALAGKYLYLRGAKHLYAIGTE